MARPLHICHVFSSFNLGGLEARSCVLMNSLGTAFRHTITATDGNFAAAGRISPDVQVRIVPPPSGKGSLLYPLRLARWLNEITPDLLVTYNWGAFDAVVGATLNRVCPVVHTEDGFNPDEAMKLKPRRVWARRIILNRVSAVVMPSRTLLEVARNEYRLRPALLRWIPNGIDASKYVGADRELWRKRWGARPRDFLIGSVGRLAPEKNLAMLVRAFAKCRFPNARLVLVGSGPCAAELQSLASELGVADRMVLPGFVPDPCGCYGAFDLFAMSSTTEQMPLSLLEAMAAGLPAIGTAVGDTAEILGDRVTPIIVPPGDMETYTQSLQALYDDAALRRRLGDANRKRCVELYSLERMISQYRELYVAAAAHKNHVRAEAFGIGPAHSGAQ